MKKYFLHNGTENLGPFDLEELKAKEITKETYVWYDGLPDWTKAGNLDELKGIIAGITPPPFEKPRDTPSFHETLAVPHFNPQKPKKKSKVIFIILGAIIGIFIVGAVIMAANNPGAIPGIKIEVNTPKPVVITARSDNSKSGLLKLRVTVYATVQNQGGKGNVLVTFHVYQDSKEFTRQKSIGLLANESQDLDATFDEVTVLGGDITYTVEARPE